MASGWEWVLLAAAMLALYMSTYEKMGILALPPVGGRSNPPHFCVKSRQQHLAHLVAVERLNFRRTICCHVV